MNLFNLKGTGFERIGPQAKCLLLGGNCEQWEAKVSDF